MAAVAYVIYCKDLGFLCGKAFLDCVEVIGIEYYDSNLSKNKMLTADGYLHLMIYRLLYLLKAVKEYLSSFVEIFH